MPCDDLALYSWLGRCSPQLTDDTCIAWKNTLKRPLILNNTEWIWNDLCASHLDVITKSVTFMFICWSPLCGITVCPFFRDYIVFNTSRVASACLCAAGNYRLGLGTDHDHIDMVKCILCKNTGCLNHNDTPYIDMFVDSGWFV